MTLTIDQKTYSQLLVEASPKVIETESEYERALSIVERLTFNQNRTPEETEIHKLFVTLVEAYEIEHYSMDEPSPHEILRHILSASNTSQADLIGVLGSERVVTEIVSGERSIDQTQAKILADRFKVSPKLFVASEVI